MTMHPDPHPPHPVRPFDAEPPAYRRYPVAGPLSIRPPRRSLRQGARSVVLAVLECAVFLVVLAGMAALKATVFVVLLTTRRSTWRIVLAVGLAILDAVAFIVALLALMFAIMLMSSDAHVNAWGLWFRGIFGGW
jgi:hypothetical protein